MKTHVSILSVVVLVVILSMPGSTTAQTTWHVNWAGGEDFTDIQTALSTVAGGAGHIIIVRDGTYTGANNRDLDFGGKAITLQSDNGAVSTTIDCQNLGRGFYITAGEGSDTVIDGFTIKNGGNVTDGGGFLVYNSDPTITNCIIKNCTASGAGGGLYAEWYSDPDISNCVFRNNTAIAGGGIYAYDYSDPVLTNCMIKDNVVVWGGGGILCDVRSDPELTNCVIADNQATNGDGGGIYAYDYSDPYLINCTLENNSAQNGGGIYLEEYCYPTIRDSIMWNNSASSSGPEGYLALPVTTLTVMYCDVDGA